MRITVWTLAWDTNYGTGAAVFTDEDSALSEMFDMAVSPHVEADDLERVTQLFWEDAYDVLAIYKPEMDTFTHESHTVEISAACLARQWLKGWLDDIGLKWRRWQARRAT